MQFIGRKSSGKAKMQGKLKDLSPANPQVKVLILLNPVSIAFSFVELKQKLAPHKIGQYKVVFRNVAPLTKDCKKLSTNLLLNSYGH